MARRLWERRAKGSDDAAMFTTPLGTPLDDSCLRKILSRAGKAAGVPWVTPHTLASMLSAEGRNAKQVAAWLGHRDPAFTIRTYLHLLDDGLGGADFLDGLATGESSLIEDSRRRIAG